MVSSFFFGMFLHASDNISLQKQKEEISNACQKVNNSEMQVVIGKIVAAFNTVNNYEDAPSVNKISEVFNKSNNAQNNNTDVTGTHTSETVTQSSDDLEKILLNKIVHH